MLLCPDITPDGSSQPPLVRWVVLPSVSFQRCSLCPCPFLFVTSRSISGIRVGVGVECRVGSRGSHSLLTVRIQILPTATLVFLASLLAWNLRLSSQVLIRNPPVDSAFFLWWHPHNHLPSFFLVSVLRILTATNVSTTTSAVYPCSVRSNVSVPGILLVFLSRCSIRHRTGSHRAAGQHSPPPPSTLTTPPTAYTLVPGNCQGSIFTSSLTKHFSHYLAHF
jgi:hypothetical protein